jgi:multimeric flavodoxin WrbA
MDIVVISASPNQDGLTAACMQAALEGIQTAGGQAQAVQLNDLKVGMCKACENGWGICRTEHKCQTEDDFQALHTQLLNADGFVLITPVYWGEMSESAKALTDRLRRCEASSGNESRLSMKPVIAVAAAGGSGGGMITCLLGIERWIQHVRLRTFDLIPVNRWSREYKVTAIHSAAQAMVTELAALALAK